MHCGWDSGWVVCFAVLLGSCGLWNGGFRNMVDEVQ